MNTPKKTLFIVSIIFTGILSLLTAASRTIVLEGCTRLEEQNVRMDVQRVQDSIADVVESMKSSAADRALRNDSYDFITDGSADYIENNLGNTEISVLKLNFMVFVNPSGKVVHAKFLDWKNKKEIPEPKNLLKALLAAVDSSDKKGDIAGILMIPQFPVLIVSKPIQKKNLSDDRRGFLIAGRFLDTDEMTRIGNLTHLKPDIRTSDAPISDDYKTALAQIRRGNRMPVFPLPPASIAGYALHNDLYGKPAFILKVEKSREIYRLGQKTIFYHTLFLIFIGLFFILFIRLSLSSSALQKKNSDPEQEISVHKQTIGTLSEEVGKQSAESESPATISHDIRTSMNAIVGFAELLSSLVTDERQKNYIRMIQSNSERLLPLIRKILDLSETEAEKSDIRNAEISFGHSSAEAKEQSVEKNILSENSTILIADDVNVNRLLLKAFFKDTNIRIIEAENGLEAFAAAEQNLPDVVLMDIGMPVMDGIEAVKRIKENIAFLSDSWKYFSGITVRSADRNLFSTNDEGTLYNLENYPCDCGNRTCDAGGQSSDYVRRI